MSRAAALLLGLAAAGCAAAPRSPYQGYPVPGSAFPLAAPLEGGSGDGGYVGYGDDGAYGEHRPLSWEDRDRVQTSLMPYAWRTSGDGDSLVRETPASFDEGSDAQDAFGGRVEFYSERIGFFVDGCQTSIHDTKGGTEYDDRTFVLDVGVAMRVAGGDPWQGPGERPPLDLEVDGIALIRTHFMKMDAHPAGAFSSISDDEIWGDLVLGMRGALVVVGTLSVYGKIEGGGMACNLWHSWTYDADVGLRLRITKNLAATAGYRWFGSRWEEGSPETVVTPFGPESIDSHREVHLRGPWVGIVLQF